MAAAKGGSLSLFDLLTVAARLELRGNDKIARPVDVDQRRLVGGGMVAEAQVQVGDVAVDRRPDLGELEIQMRRMDPRLRRAQTCVRVPFGAQIGLVSGEISFRLELRSLRLQQLRPGAIEYGLGVGDVGRGLVKPFLGGSAPCGTRVA